MIFAIAAVLVRYGELVVVNYSICHTTYVTRETQ